MLVRAADKIDMMIQALQYDREGKKGLEAFWKNEGNFEDFGIPELMELLSDIRRKDPTV